MKDTVDTFPRLWARAPLKDLGQWTGGGTPSKAKPQYWEGGAVPWVSPKDMKTEHLTDSEDHITEDAVAESTANLIPAGSVLMVTRSGILRHSFPVAVASVPVTVNQDLKAVAPAPGIHSEFVAWALRAFSQDILNDCSKQGTTVNSVETSKLLRFEIPIAPHAEQKRIVAEIEKQFSRLDEAVANLKRVQANLKRYKAAVLKAAVEGKLTEEWRKQHLPAPTSTEGKFYTYAILCEYGSIYIGHTDDIERRWREHRQGMGAEWTKEHKPLKIAHYEEFGTRNEAADREKWLKTGYGRTWLKRELAAGRTRQAGDVEPADHLLARIGQRRAVWLEAAIAEGDSEAKRLKAKLKKHEFQPPEKNNLPGAWAWASLLGCCQLVVDCHNKTAPYEPAGVPLVRTTNVRDGRLLLDGIKYVSEETCAFWSRRCPPAPGDILFTREAPMGEATIIPEGVRLCMGQRMMLLRVFPELVDPKFLLFALMSAPVQQRLQQCSIGTGVQHARVGDVESLVVPLPSTDEQKSIVAQVEQALSIVEQTEVETLASLRRADRLRQSILQKAFSGQLVAQDPAGEPASVLLERLRAERAAGRAGLAPPRKAKRSQPKHAATKGSVSKSSAGQAPLYANNHAAAILTFMQPGKEYSRADVIDVLGLTVGQWNAGIRELKESGAVVQRGERRGARYFVAEGSFTEARGR